MAADQRAASPASPRRCWGIPIIPQRRPAAFYHATRKMDRVSSGCHVWRWGRRKQTGAWSVAPRREDYHGKGTTCFLNLDPRGGVCGSGWPCWRCLGPGARRKRSPLRRRRQPSPPRLPRCPSLSSLSRLRRRPTRVPRPCPTIRPSTSLGTTWCTIRRPALTFRNRKDRCLRGHGAW